MERAAKKFTSIRDLVVAIGFFVTLVAGGVLALSKLQEKPSTADMVAAIDGKVDPVVVRLEPVEDSVELLQDNVERMQQIQEIQMIHSEWRAKVEDCRARPSCKRAPNKPPELEQKKRALMTRPAH